MNYLQTVVEYVEGRMSFEEFDSLLCADADFARWIEKSAPGDWRCFTLATADNNYKPEELPFTIRQLRIQVAYGRALGSLAYQRNFHDWMKMFLQEAFPELEIHPKFPSEEMYFLTMDACPQYIDGIEIRQNKILENIVGECDENWAKSKKIKYIKSRIREVFHLENKKYPRWLQDPEWPIANGKPMKFIRTTVKARNEWHQHHFIDPDTQEERVIDDMS